MSIDHAEAIYSYRSDAVTNMYQGWIPKDIEDVRSFIERQVSTELNVNGTWFQFVVILKETGEVIGDMGLHFIGSDNDEVELGCTIAIEHQGKGYATEALTEVISYIFGKLDKNRITATITPANSRSINLFERLNFKKETFSREGKVQNEFQTDDLLYTLQNSLRL
jgi:RimJ/RimL family protein N-acetyltransferase